LPEGYIYPKQNRPSRHCVLYPYRMGPGNVDRNVEDVTKRD
jgi:hypothetical protein